MINLNCKQAETETLIYGLVLGTVYKICMNIARSLLVCLFLKVHVVNVDFQCTLLFYQQPVGLLVTVLDVQGADKLDFLLLNFAKH